MATFRGISDMNNSEINIYVKNILIHKPSENIIIFLQHFWNIFGEILKCFCNLQCCNVSEMLLQASML